MKHCGSSSFVASGLRSGLGMCPRGTSVEERRIAELEGRPLEKEPPLLASCPRQTPPFRFVSSLYLEAVDMESKVDPLGGGSPGGTLANFDTQLGLRPRLVGSVGLVF